MVVGFFLDAGVNSFTGLCLGAQGLATRSVPLNYYLLVAYP